MTFQDNFARIAHFGAQGQLLTRAAIDRRVMR